MKKILLLLFISTLISLPVLGQVEKPVTFINKKDTLKKHTYALPIFARVKAKKNKTILLIEVNDSLVTGLQYIYERKTALSEEETNLCRNYYIEMGKISRNKNLSENERKAKIFELARMVYLDTIQYTQREVKKIVFAKEKYSKIESFASYTTYAISGVTLVVGAVSLLEGETQSGISPIVAGGIGIAGIGGIIGSYIWIKHVAGTHIRMKKWTIKD